MNRPKKGFVFPWDRWLRQELRNRAEEILTRAPILEAVGLRAAQVAALWRDFLAGKPGLRYTDVLSLMHLLAWVEKHRVES